MSDFTTIMNQMLERIPNTFDKRVGSIIYDALAPSAAEQAQLYILLEIYKEQTNILSATDENLDNRGMDFGVARQQATKSIRIGTMYNQSGLAIDSIEIGSRFAIPNESGGLTYIITESLGNGEYLLECEQSGIRGNEYYGDILPLEINNMLGKAIMTGTQVPAEDVEPDEVFRARIIERLNNKAFGGNIADYKQFTKAIEGVGELKVFPIWNGRGTVLLSVVDSNYNPISDNFKVLLKEIIDPEEYTGMGIGTAPIDHNVTIATPIEKTINISATLTLSGVTVGQVQSEVERLLNEYLLSVRKQWSESAVMYIYIARIVENILKVPNVVNVRNVTINGLSDDMELIDTPEVQFLPFLGEVVLIE